MRRDGSFRSAFNGRTTNGGPRRCDSGSGGMRQISRYYNPPPMLMQPGPSMPYMMPHPMQMNYQPSSFGNGYGFGAQMTPYWNYPPMIQNQMPVYQPQSPPRNAVPSRPVTASTRTPRDRRPNAEPRISIGSTIHSASSALISTSFGQARTLSEALDEVSQNQAMDQQQQGFNEPVQPLQDPRIKSPIYRNVLPAPLPAGMNQILEKAKDLALIKLPDAVSCLEKVSSLEDQNRVAKNLVKNPLFGHHDPFQLVRKVAAKAEEKFIPKVRRGGKRARSSSPSLLDQDTVPVEDGIYPVFKKANMLECIAQVVPNDGLNSKLERKAIFPTDCIELTEDEDGDEIMIIEKEDSIDTVCKEIVKWFIDREPSNFYVPIADDRIEVKSLQEEADDQSKCKDDEQRENTCFYPPTGKQLPPLSNFSFGVSELELKQTVVSKGTFLRIKQSLDKLRGARVEIIKH